MKLSDILLESFQVTGYHGTNSDIKSFKGVVYFTDQQDASEGYARGKVKIHKSGVAKVYEVKLDFKNPFYCDTLQQIGTMTQADINELKKQGYDGAVYKGTKKEPIPEYLPFYPEKLKIERVIDVK